MQQEATAISIWLGERLCPATVLLQNLAKPTVRAISSSSRINREVMPICLLVFAKSADMGLSIFTGRDTWGFCRCQKASQSFTAILNDGPG